MITRLVPVVAVERLKRRSDFHAAARDMGASAGGFALQAHRRADDGVVRVGFTVSKQVGNAVERNRVRRRLREIVRLAAGANAFARDAGNAGMIAAGLRAGHDYVLIGRRAALAKPFGAMMRDLDAALSRIHRPQRGGTGGARRAPLHEAGSFTRPQNPRRSRKHSQNPPREPDQESPEHPLHES